MENERLDIVESDEDLTELQIAEVNSRERVAERRKKQFEMRLRGIKRSEIQKTLSEEYGVTPECIDQDWRRRDSWVLDVVGVTDITGLIASTIGGLSLTQSFRREVLEDILRLSKNLVKSDGSVLMEDIETLPFVWNMLLKVLKDIDESEKSKSDILLKLGILKEAPKHIRVERKDTTVHHSIDWTKVVSGMDEDAKKRLFDEVGAIEAEFSLLDGDEGSQDAEQEQSND
jgi:hypothetical protein